MNPQSSYGPAKEKTRDAGGQHLAFRFFPLSGSSTSFNEASFNEAQLGWSQLFPPQPLPGPVPAAKRDTPRLRQVFQQGARYFLLAQTINRGRFDLADPLPGQPKHLAHFLQRMDLVVVQSIAHRDNLLRPGI